MTSTKHPKWDMDSDSPLPPAHEDSTNTDGHCYWHISVPCNGWGRKGGRTRRPLGTQDA